MGRLSYTDAHHLIDGSVEDELAVGLAMLVSGQNPDGSSAATFGYAAGVAGTATPPVGARVRRIRAVGAAAATAVIDGGTAIPLPAGATFDVDLEGALVGDGSTVTVVFTSTTSYFVGWEI